MFNGIRQGRERPIVKFFSGVVIQLIILLQVHGGLVQVTDVQSVQNYVLHIGTISEGELSVGDEVRLRIDEVCTQFTARKMLTLIRTAFESRHISILER